MMAVRSIHSASSLCVPGVFQEGLPARSPWPEYTVTTICRSVPRSHTRTLYISSVQPGPARGSSRPDLRSDRTNHRSRIFRAAKRRYFAWIQSDIIPYFL